MSKRYSTQWRKPYRKQRRRRSIQEKTSRIIRRAVSGDIRAIVTILKATGELPEDYKLTD